MSVSHKPVKKIVHNNITTVYYTIHGKRNTTLSLSIVIDLIISNLR